MTHSSRVVCIMQDKVTKYSEQLDIMGIQLKAARGLLRWEQKKLSELTGISLTSINRFEATDGPINCSFKNAKILFNIFNDNDIVFVNDENEVSVKLLKK